MEADGENCREPEQNPLLQADTENKTADSSDADTDDSDCWKENRRDHFTSEKHHKVPESCTTLYRNTFIQQFTCGQDLSQNTEFHTEVQREEEQEELTSTDIKEEQEELVPIKEDSVPIKTEEDEEKPQSSKLHQGNSVGQPDPDLDSNIGGVYFKSDDSVDSDFWKDTRQRQSGNDSGRNLFSSSDETNLQPESDDSIDSDFWKDGRNSQLGSNSLKHNGVSDGAVRDDFNWHSQIKYHKCVQYEIAEPDLCLGTTFVKTNFREARFGSDSDDDGEIFPQSRLLQQKCQKLEDSGSHSDDNQKSQKTPEDRNAQQTHLRHSTTEKPFSCSFCGKEFATGGCLTQHISIHTREKPLRCFICEKTFSEESMLISHDCIGESSHCSVCAERFSRREDFNCHFRRHQRCSVCNAGFSDRDSLVQHMRSHTRQTQFICSVCGKDFAWRRHLTKHMENHVKKLYRCGVCGANFVSYYRFTKHQRAHHRTAASVTEGYCVLFFFKNCHKI
uniref:C2H2-type domain-containing protein n=1 Tax=Amphiprion percula TaxID=161767 RepID=A0A3P8TR39_AMPPE